jgi:hypothetical protein
LGLRQRADGAGDLFGGKEQKAVAAEKRVFAELLDRWEQGGLRRQLLGEGLAGRARLFRRGRIDDDKNFFVISLKCVSKRKLSLTPRQVRRD